MTVIPFPTTPATNFGSNFMRNLCSSARQLLALLSLILTTTLAVNNAGAAVFQEGDLLMVQAAPDVIHYSNDPDHADHSWLVGLEWQSAENWLGGAAYFNNSFDQKSQYIYFGKVWPVEAVNENLYVKLTGGLLLGYKKPYENKIPINWDGVGLGALPAIGYKFGDASIQINFLGTAGVMFTFGYDLLK